MNNKDFILSVGIIVALIVNGLVNVNPLLHMPFSHDAAAQSSSSLMLATNASAALSDNNATSNFLTYENSTYGIKIQYPSEWLYKEGEITGTNSNDNNNTAIDNSSSSPVQTIVSFAPIKNPTASYLKIGVIDLNTRSLNVDLLANSLMANKAQVFPGMNISKLNSTTLAGSPAYKFVLTSNQDNRKALNYFTVKEDKAYLIGYFAKSPEIYSTYLPTALKMVDTFQIIGNGTISQKPDRFTAAT